MNIEQSQRDAAIDLMNEAVHQMSNAAVGMDDEYLINSFRVIKGQWAVFKTHLVAAIAREEEGE